MGAHTADSKFSFELPSMSYIDAKWEEPTLRAPAATPALARNRGLAAWLSHKFAALRAWHLDHAAASELSSMTDRELLDIGLSRADVGRVFAPAYSMDLRQRGI
jgi:uncharacterized protein YjiS (DUF1127 family)